MKILRLIPALAAALLLFTLCACAGGSGQIETTTPPPASPGKETETPSASPDTPSTPSLQPGDTADPTAPVTVSGEIVVTFDYEKQSGSASNQYAVWVEDMDGQLIKTLYATRWTADGGFKTRPDSIALWVEKSDLASLTKTDVDAISGATPQTGTQTYTWDLTDANGDTVLPGEYKVLVEGTLRWKNYVLYTGAINVNDTATTVQADAEFVYETSERYAALTSESPENAMIGVVIVDFVPGANR